MQQWAGKTVVVVSVSVGSESNPAAMGGHLGLACARDFAAHGAQVLAVDPDQAALDALCAESPAIQGFRADLLDPVGMTAAGQACLDRFGRADALVTCHSDIELGSIEELSFESWRRVVEFDLLGPVFAAKAFLPALKRAEGAAVVHIGSIDGTLGNPQYPSYSTAKGGIVPLTHVMAQEFGRHGIRVNCVARAFIAARGHEPTPAQRHVLHQTPLGRPGHPDEVAAVVRFLASAEAAYVSGVVVPIDGGRSGLTPGTIPLA